MAFHLQRLPKVLPQRGGLARPHLPQVEQLPLQLSLLRWQLVLAELVRVHQRVQLEATALGSSKRQLLETFQLTSFLAASLETLV